MTGEIISLKESGFGFIRKSERPRGKDIFFSRSELHLSLDFGRHLQNMRVEFEVAENEKGIRAVNVRPVV